MLVLSPLLLYEKLPLAFVLYCGYFVGVYRKAYGAGLYAMSGPAFEPDATICLPSAKIAVMGPEPAVNAVYANKIAAIEDESERELFVKEKRREYEQDVDLLRLAADLIVDSVVQPGELRNELIRRMQAVIL